MDTLVESPRVPFVSGSSLPSSSPFSFSRLIVPCLGIAIGISVGSATGLTLALVNSSNQIVTASSDSVEPSTSPAPSLSMNGSPANASSRVANQSIAAVPAAPPAAAASNRSVITTDAPKMAVVNLVPVKKAATAKLEIAFNKTPDALKPATLKLNGKEWPVAKPMARAIPPSSPSFQPHPLVAAEATPAILNPSQLSLDTPTPARLYTEGDLTVSDYNELAGTVQTSDGKTFVLGTTVAAADAASWESYRSDLHYRCDQNGSCVLMRAGVVAPDAKLI